MWYQSRKVFMPVTGWMQKQKKETTEDRHNKALEMKQSKGEVENQGIVKSIV
jgi:hypothetical protein